MAGPAPTAARNFGGLTGQNLAAGVNNTDAVNVGQATSLANTAQTNSQSYTDNQIAGLQSGQTLKGTVRAYTATNINTTSPGSTIDGLTPANGDIFLLGGQTTGSQNGPWVWNGATSAMTRPTNWNSQAQAVVGSFWIVREGTSADVYALMTNDAFTLGTTTAAFKLVGIAQAAQVNGNSDVSPALSAGQTWTFNHNLGTRALTITFWKNSGNYDLVDPPNVYKPSVNQITIVPEIAMAAGEYMVAVTKAA